ncbi:Peroxin-3-domain-containing protein [Chiua virens]|nr:Peroxin-3-domain-containing protein [Chiua virens]
MFDTIQRYVHKRRSAFIQSATFLCGSYILTAYVNERLEETKDKMVREKLARDNLRRRFQSTHDDVCFTIMALIPTLASQILEDMDVEALTNELQSISRASRSRTLLPLQNQLRSQSVSDVSSVSDVHSDAGSVSFSSYSGSGTDNDRASAVSGSWVAQMSSSDSPLTRSDPPVLLSDSITSASSSLSHTGRNVEDSGTFTNSRTKAQLWNEVKILGAIFFAGYTLPANSAQALTRTLTTLYTITLVSLLTGPPTVQERERDNIPHFSLTGILAREAVARIVDVESIWPAWILGDIEDGDEADENRDAISEATELRFLTLSWWVLHVGWKDVAARVRGSVESVFDDVSLKTKLSASELFTLFMDVRRRVEMDDTGSKLGARFLSSIIPPTPETTAHVLAQGGALSIPRENTHGSIDHSKTKSPSNPNSSSWSGGDSEQSIPLEGIRDGLTRATAIPIKSPAPRLGVFPTPPSSHAHESDLSSRASQSPSISPALRFQSAPSAGKSGLLATSRGTLDIDPQFSTLLVQTRRYLSGPDFAHALGCALDRATEVLMDGLRTRVFADSASAVNVINPDEAPAQSVSGALGPKLEKKDEVKVRLAGLLPGLSRWCQLALNATPNELVDNIMAVREVNALEAIIMSDYEDRFPAIS